MTTAPHAHPPITSHRHRAVTTRLACHPLAQLHDHKLKVTGTDIHPLAGVPDALEALRLKASRRRLTDHYKDKASLQAIVRIQSLGRRRIAHASTKMIKATHALG